MSYNYYEAMVEDIKDYINENINLSDYSDRDELEEKLNDKLFVEDSVTGNASGSYTFNSYTAMEYVTDNMDLLNEVVDDGFAEEEEIGKLFLSESWETMDVIIRCYILGSCIQQALDELNIDDDYLETLSEE